MRTMLDSQLEPPFKEPTPERLCFHCYINMDWLEDEAAFACPQCEEFIALQDIYFGEASNDE
jgi:hypothetical protein